MSNVKISELETTSAVSTSDLMETAIPSGNNYASKKMSIAQLATYLENSVVHSALDTQNKTIIDAINELKSICDSLSASHFIVANQLPTSDINMNAIYLIPKQSTGVNDVYEEYICLDDTTTPATWEKIGETQIDLSNYITFDDADIATTSKNGSMSKADRSKMNGIESGAQKNVQSDWNASSGDAFIKNKPTIPDELADLADDSTHRVVTDTEKATWNDNRAVSEIRLTNEDLDNVTTVGFYYAAGGNTVTNKPSGYSNFGLVVIHNASGSQYTQIISNENGSHRRIKKSNGTWTSWALDNFTDEKVNQSPFASPIPNANYPLLIANSANETEERGAVWKNTNITYNPSSNTFNVNNGTVKAYTGQYSELVSTFIGFMAQNTLLAYFSPNPNQASGTTVEAVMPATSGTLALQSELPTEAVEWTQNNLLGSKNLLPLKTWYKNGYTQNGNVITVNGDGTIYVDRSSMTGQFTFYITDYYVNGGCYLPNGTYYLSGCPAGGSQSTSSGYQLGVRILKNGATTSLGNDSGDGLEFTVNGDDYSQDGAWIRTIIVFRNNSSTNNFTFKPMIIPISVKNKTFTAPAKTNINLTIEAQRTLDMIATSEPSNYTSKAYTVGEYMVHQGKLYRVTSAISNNGAISIGTNVTETTLGAEIKRALT